ncbi:proteasome-type protease [Chamaesiphon minutus]|uniref:Putative proteasome-type protease n=1 Tax=Chamaesiphon minutus (strain ATCC 27169 / PCC 6605) TaxID=1173020 RepID=K9UP85_CHAP6|nr:proteasome-type protease [Chamaesiphon minutus]AFY96009.1 putative proteasome-type protease [Chamaesiphon minutus PCC 6605]
MTYCLGIISAHGLVMVADSRTNAGVDYISTYRKMFDFSVSGDRTILLCTSGNLSITQSVLLSIEQDLRATDVENLHSCHSLYEMACYIGQKLRQVQAREREWLEKDRIDASCNLLLGGQVRGQPIELYMLYTQGNFIKAMPETPFLQIGEIKYGKPILDRTLTFNTSTEDAVKAAILSFDSTMKSNVSVGPPIDLIVYRADSFEIRHKRTLHRGDPYLLRVRREWECHLKSACDRMPAIDWDTIEEPSLGEFSGFLNS